MSFDWSQLRAVAIELAQVGAKDPTQPLNEARLRSAVSRFYYASHCIARNALQTEGERFSDSGAAHREVWQCLKQSRDQQRQKLGTDLERLYHHRRVADYENRVDDISGLIFASRAYSERIEKYFRDVPAKKR